MTRYLLDTTALIDFSKGREVALSRILEMTQGDDELGVCAINVAEFYAGVPPTKRPTWDEFFASLGYWEITVGEARQAGCFRHDFARQGKALSTIDALVAAVAQERQATIVTNNIRDYPMEGVHLLPLVD